jgi:hypothetical protein
MLVVSAEEGAGSQKLLFALSKPKVKERCPLTPSCCVFHDLVLAHADFLFIYFI